MTKLSIDELNHFVENIKAFSQTDMISNEANTKKKIIEPLLEMLGWDLLSNEVRLEHPIKVGTTSGHADYALTLEGKAVVLVEVKAFDANLSSEHSSQIISYGRIEDVRWVVLTNGRLLKIFDTEEGKTESECLVTEIDLKEATLHASDLRLISRESILTGEIEATAKRLAATKKAIISLGQNKKEIAEEIKKTLLRITGTEIENRVENISKKLAEQAIQLFKKEFETIPERVTEEAQLITRKELAVKPPGEVVLCPSKISGVEFLKKYNAWGFVTINKRVPYFALYVGKPESSVLYFGEVESITQPIKSKEDLEKIEEKDIGAFPAGKRTIHLKPGTLMKLKDPIPLKNKKTAPRGLRYTTLEKLIQAHNIGEL